MATKFSSPLISCIFFLIFFFLPLLSHSHPHHEVRGIIGNETHQSPYGFLKNIQGYHKGDKNKNIHALKLYLSRFGYLNYQNYPNSTTPNDDAFDEDLEAALKTYQVYHHLNATGTLDEPTVSQMVMPRCGFPDMVTHNHNHDHDPKSFHTVSHYRFFRGRPRWPRRKRRLTYAFGPRFPARFMPPVARAFRKWAIASRYFTFVRTRNYRRADLKISFERRDHGDGRPFDGRGRVLAHAFAPPDGRFHYDADELWVVGAVPNAYDVETLALHEIGHLLGLDHSQFQTAIMWGSFSPGVIKGRLTADDIRGIRALYRR